MTTKSIAAIVQVTAHLLIFAWQYVQQMQVTSSALAFETQLYLWGAFFLRTMLITVLVQIILSILSNIIIRIKTGDRVDAHDERDRLIELRSLRNFTFVFALGFYLAMTLLVFNFSLAVMFQTLAFSYLLAGVTLSASQIIYYERGN